MTWGQCQHDHAISIMRQEGSVTSLDGRVRTLCADRGKKKGGRKEAKTRNQDDEDRADLVGAMLWRNIKCPEGAKTKEPHPSIT